MVSCGLQNDPAIPWKNHSSSKHHTRDVVLQDFCECISCAFLPAVRDNATLSVPKQCDKDTPSLKVVVEKLAIDLCGRVKPNSLDACSEGFKWSAKAKCESGEASCVEYQFTLGLASLADFDARAQLDFLGRLAALAKVPMASLYIKSVRPGSVVATVGVYESYSANVAAVTTGGGDDPAGGVAAGAANSADLSAAIGVPVQNVIASGSNSQPGGVGSLLSGASNGRVAAAIVLPILFLCILAILIWRWRLDRCKGVTDGAVSEAGTTATTAVVSVEKQSAPPPPARNKNGEEDAAPSKEGHKAETVVDERKGGLKEGVEQL